MKKEAVTGLDALISRMKQDPRMVSQKDRSGYYTNLSGKKEERFVNPAVHGTIYADSIFQMQEQIMIAVETIDAIDIQRGNQYFYTSFHNHDFFEMIYVYKGHCTTTIEGRAETLHEGSICIYNLQVVHQLLIEDKESVVFNIIMKKEIFDSTFIHLIDNTNTVSGFFIRSLYDISTPTRHMVFPFWEGSGLCEYMEKLIMEYERKHVMYQNMMYSFLIGLFITLARQYQDKIANQSIQESRLDIVQIISYMAMHYRSLTLEQLADHFNYTTRSMIRLIRKYTYRTFREIITEFRMTEACRLLKSGSHTILEIALMTGYKDRSYFDKVFKEMYKVTPAKYR